MRTKRKTEARERNAKPQRRTPKEPYIKFAHVGSGIVCLRVCIKTIYIYVYKNNVRMLLSLRRKSEEQKRKERKRNKKGNEEERELNEILRNANGTQKLFNPRCIEEQKQHAEAPQGAQAEHKTNIRRTTEKREKNKKEKGKQKEE